MIGPHYNASKAGMEGLTRGYAARLAKEGITVNSRAARIDRDRHDRRPCGQLSARIPVGRMGAVEEVAQAVLSFVANGYVTGETIQVNGGLQFT